MALLWFTIVGGFIFVPLNIRDGNPSLAWVEASVMLACVALLFVVPRSRHLQWWTLAFLIGFFTLMLFAFATPRAKASVFVWVMLIPILAHLLLGQWLGMAVAAFYMIAAGLIFLWKYGTHLAFADLLAAADVTMCALCVFGFSHIYEISRQRTERRLRRMAFMDPLTGLANRTSFRDLFDRESQRALRDATPLAILLIDLDNFKRVNDIHGHDAGDSALRCVADILRERLRGTDLAGRLGGEEFGVILSGATVDRACVIAEDLRRTTIIRPCTYKDRQIALSMTIGVAALNDDGHDLKALFAKADQRLYRGKAEGRNRVVGPEGSIPAGACERRRHATVQRPAPDL